MTLPHAHLALIDPAKVRGYLLSASHPIGRFKYAPFLSLGYTADAWEQLGDDLLTIARADPAIPGSATAFGQKFEVDNMLTGPNGNTARINTVWIMLAGESAPRFVTALPR